MARPDSPPRPDAARPRPGSGKARPTAKSRPAPKAPPKPQVASGNGSADPNELVLSPAPSRPASSQKHLKMVPLNGQSENTYDDGKDMGSGSFSRPGRSVGGEVGVQSPMAPPMMGPPSAPMGIQGPVAGMPGGMPMGGMPMGGMPMGGMPMGPMVNGPMMGQPGMMMPMEERATSTRVYMVIMGLVLMVCASIVATFVVVLVAFVASNQPEPVPEIKQQVVMAAPTTPIDTASNRAPEPEPSRPTKRNRGGSKEPSAPRPASGPKPAPAAAPPPPEASGAPGPVSVTLPAGVFATSFQVNCPDASFSERGMFNGGNRATIANVPAGGCHMVLVGSGSKRKFNFQGSHDFKCSGVGSDVICR